MGGFSDKNWAIFSCCEQGTRGLFEKGAHIILSLLSRPRNCSRAVSFVDVIVKERAIRGAGLIRAGAIQIKWGNFWLC